MALNQDGVRSTELFRVGTDRNDLIAEFGNPVSSGITADGRKYEKFVFSKGSSYGAKTGRAFIHAVADLLTYGLWEVVATSTEKTLSSNEVAYEVAYDDSGKVNQWARVKAVSENQMLARNDSRQSEKTRLAANTKEKPEMLPYKNYASGIKPYKMTRTSVVAEQKASAVSYSLPRTGTEARLQIVARASQI